jgi:hypothetical protein
LAAGFGFGQKADSSGFSDGKLLLNRFMSGYGIEDYPEE